MSLKEGLTLVQTLPPQGNKSYLPLLWKPQRGPSFLSQVPILAPSPADHIDLVHFYMASQLIVTLILVCDGKGRARKRKQE